MELTKDELVRYSRQMIIRGWGKQGQLKLKESKVAVLGIGGLGSPACLYLAAAGIGHLRIVDSDVVDMSNLNRQIAHWSTDLGRPKIESAAMKIVQLNPDIEVDPLNECITKDSVSRLLNGVDLVVDGLDNLEARMIVNEECVRKQIPYVYGAVYGMEGYLTTIMPHRSPCLRCIYPSEIRSQEKFPIVGTTPGVIGNLEATEALKVLTGIGKPAVGRLIVYDGERMSFHEITIRRSCKCPICGDKK